MFDLNLEWKSFNISLPDVKAWLEANVSTPSVGMSANSVLQIHFLTELSQEEKDMIQTYWDELIEESEEATSYQSKEQIEATAEADRAAKLATASAKLEALGLTEDEIKAILG